MGEAPEVSLGVSGIGGSVSEVIDLLQQGSAYGTFAQSISAADVGKAVYVSSTTGQATTTAPSASGSYVIHLGWLQSDDGTCLIDPKTINYNS